MVKVLLAMFLLGFSFSGQAHWEECDLNAEILHVRTFCGFRTYAKARGEKEMELTDGERKRLLCRKINQCIGNGQGSLEQLGVLFEMNEC